VTSNLKYTLILLLALFVVSCSTKKNTGVSRVYHNLTSHYNILFNGEESYKKGLKKLEESYDDDFTELLPVFLYEDKDALNNISAEMDRSIKKMTKLISMHSLTVKPELKPDKQLSQKQKEFYSQKEFNKYIDDAYLLMGKSHLYKQELSQASETFEYIVSNFPESETAFETKIWIGRLACLEGNYREAQDILDGLSKNLELPKRLRGELYASQSDLLLKQKQYAEAIEPLEKAIDFSSGKFIRARYIFLLAQLYSKQGNNKKASENYDKVVKMTFSAQINRALSYQSGTDSKKSIEKELRKMLKDDKNIEYQDQIYYALGSMYLRDKQVDKAIENFVLSIQKSTDNKRQKAKTSLTLAELYYSKPDYINAQCYYDTAVAVIDKDYPDYRLIYTKSVSLNELVLNINTVEFEDSVLKLADKSQEDLIAYIDDLIEKEMEAEEEKKIAEAELAEERMANMNDLALQTNQNTGNWYFYNPNTKSLGRKEFQRVWGSRKLEDNWRRKNKNVVNFAEPVETEGEEIQATRMPGEIVTDKRTRNYYLQYIPLTDSAKEQSQLRIMNSLHKMGEIYSDDLKDYPKAVNSFEELLKRFPRAENKLNIYYKLYTLARNTEDIDRVNKYQQAIVREYPNSNFAKLMTNPDYIKEIAAEEKKVYDFYDETYRYFKSSNFPVVLDRTSHAMREYPDHELYPRFDYMHTIAAGVRKDTLAFVNDLEKLITRYPATDIALQAQLMVKFLQDKSPDLVIKQNLQIATELYVLSGNETHYFVYLVPASMNLNQLIFNIVNFNLDNFDNLKLEVKRQNLDGKRNLCSVQKFNNADEAMVYFREITASSDVLRDINASDVIPFIISQTNLAKLTETLKADQYVLFFKKNYR
jgi:tetratricopeptide (TPR) repeat protein